ncbi:MAG: hypothetical protein ACREQA_00165 [Candidatus Binatia bacterium]
MRQMLALEERVGSLFQPDTLLSTDYFEQFHRKIALEPEKRLMLEVLEEAVACFQRYVLAQNRKGRRLFREAEEWILEEDGDWLFSFENICEVLGLDPRYVLEGLLKWKKMKLAGLPKTKIYRLNPRRMRKRHRAMMPGSTRHHLQRAASH